MARFSEDIADPDLLRELAESHTKAVDEYGAFGVPDLWCLTAVISPSSRCSFRLKNSRLRSYDNLMKSMSEFVHVGEFKRPQPPWPHGVI